jgi:hypothetical protein
LIEILDTATVMGRLIVGVTIPIRDIDVKWESIAGLTLMKCQKACDSQLCAKIWSHDEVTAVRWDWQ